MYMYYMYIKSVNVLNDMYVREMCHIACRGEGLGNGVSETVKGKKRKGARGNFGVSTGKENAGQTSKCGI